MTEKTNLQEKLTKLVSYKTSSDNPNFFGEVLELYEYFKLGCRHMRVKMVESNGFPSLVAYTKSYKKPKIVLQAHVDVVSASEEMFNARVVKQSDKNLMLGRGVFDMKFAVACYLEFLEEVGEKVQDMDIAIWLTSDEEIGSKNGMEYLLGTLGLRADAVFLPDGGYGKGLVIDAKGKQHLLLETKGVSSHGSRPWQGRNAIENVMHAYEELKAIFKPNKEHWHSTLNAGVISGGTGHNTVADYARLECDFRFINEEDKKRLHSEIKKLENKYDLSYEVLFYGAVVNTDLQNIYFKNFVNTLDAEKADYFLSRDHGASDARFVAEHGIPVIMWMPDGGNSHSKDEWVDLDSLNNFYKVMKQYLFNQLDK